MLVVYCGYGEPLVIQTRSTHRSDRTRFGVALLYQAQVTIHFAILMERGMDICITKQCKISLSKKQIYLAEEVNEPETNKCFEVPQPSITSNLGENL